MDEQDSKEAKSSTKNNKKAGLVLLLLILAVAVGIYLYQGRSLSIKGWDNDIDAAMVQAEKEQRPVVVFFVNRTPSPIARDISTKVIPKKGNQKALEEGKFIKVICSVDSGLKSETAQKYKLVKLPTFIAFDYSGKEYNRLEGTNARNEAGFREKLLWVKK